MEEVEPELGGVVGSTGTVCATAKDAGACTAALDAAVNSPGVTIPPGCGIPGPCDGHILAYTLGDAVGVVTLPAEAVGFFDSPEEAIFLAFRHNYQVSCTGDNRGGVRAVSGGYEVLATQSGCGYLARIIVFVGADGTVQERQRDVLSEGASCVH